MLKSSRTLKEVGLIYSAAQQRNFNGCFLGPFLWSFSIILAGGKWPTNSRCLSLQFYLHLRATESIIEFAVCIFSSIMITARRWYAIFLLPADHNFQDRVLLQSNCSHGTLKEWFNETFPAFLHTMLQLLPSFYNSFSTRLIAKCLRMKAY